MKKDHIQFVDSVLEVKASGLDNDVSNDLNLPQGKSIAELLYDQKKEDSEQITE